MSKKYVIKSILAIFLIVGLIVTIFSGCGDDKAEQKTKDGNIVLTYYEGDSNAKPVPLSETPVGKKVTELTGVELKIEYIVGSDEQTKAGLMIASGEYPDLINGHNETSKFIEAGALIPLNDYIEKYGENIKKAYKGDLKKMEQGEEGNIYYLAPIRAKGNMLYSDGGFWLPAGVLKELGYPKVTTFEQYIQIIKDYVKENPTYDGKETIGFTSLSDGWRICMLQMAGCQLAGYANDGGVLVDQNTFECELMETSEYHKKYLKILNELWNEGLIDKEIFSQNYDQYKAKLSTGRVIGTFDWRWQIQDSITALEQQELYDRVPIALPVLYDGVSQDKYNGPLVTSASFGIGISKDCKDPVAAFKFLDKMCSEEINKFVNWGIEGEDYSIVDGKYALSTKEQLERVTDQEYMDNQGVTRFFSFPHAAPGMGNTFSDGTVIDREHSPEYISSFYKDYEKEILKGYNIKAFPELFSPPFDSPYGYGWDVNIPDGDPAKIASNQVTDTDRKFIPILITGKVEEFEKNWNDYMEAIKQCKPESFLELRTKTYKERVENWSE